MAIKTYNPTSHGIRFRTSLGFEEITKTKPEKGLVEPPRRSGGRNNTGRATRPHPRRGRRGPRGRGGARNTTGRVTSHHRGGGHKRRFRLIDFKRDKRGIPARVQ